VSDESWYVYGIVPAGLPGVAAGWSDPEPDRPVLFVNQGAIAAAASPVPADEFEEEMLREHLRDIAWVERLALRHADVVDRLKRQTAVVPLRICTVYRSEDRVRHMLGEREASFARALSQLRDRSEWGVKVLSVGEPSLPEEERGGDADAATSGTAYLLGRRRERDLRAEADQRVEQACDEIHERLGALAVDAGINPPQRAEEGEMVLNAVYLVDDGAAERFLQHVDELGESYRSLGLAVVTTGPWPAYNFVPDELGASA
jgi:hypothetical protein